MNTYFGVFTALTTPFKNGNIDYDAAERFIEEQIQGGVRGIVPVGTTGESPTLTTPEHNAFIDFVCKKVNKRILVIAGTGSNSTAEAIDLTLHAYEAGADATLQMAPYYNKPTQEGVYRHVMEVAEKGKLPIVLYNIPGRTGIGFEVSTIERLYHNAPVAALKEAGGSVERVSVIHQRLPELSILCGDDGLTLPMIACGACGVISVASNLIPRELVQMVDAARAGDLKAAQTLHERYHTLFNVLFIETNPIPIKAALSLMGKQEESYRLPLCEMSAEHREILAAEMRRLNLI